MILLRTNNVNSSTKIAEKNYEPSDYQNKNELNAGLAVTHEQVSDSFAEGNSDAVIDNLEGKNVTIKRKGFVK